jgi:hypothetical protein
MLLFGAVGVSMVWTFFAFRKESYAAHLAQVAAAQARQPVL